jgi:probable HAF family extracellular repeat protein
MLFRSHAVAAITLATLAGSALGQASFRTIPPDKGFDYTVVQDVSADGTKVLVSLQNSTKRPSVPFSYVLNLADDARVDIADPSGRSLNAIAINANGSVVVGSLGGGPLVDAGAFVWTEEVFLDIGGLPAGNVSYATGVSADGTMVVGTSGANFGDPYQQGWRWTPNYGFIPLNDVGDDILTFSATAHVSDDGSTVVGYGTIGDFDPDTDDFQRAAIWPKNGIDPIDIGILPNRFNLGAQGYGASADGSVVVGFGVAEGPNNSIVNHAFRWTAKSGMVDLGAFPGNDDASIYLLDCSADGSTAVGYLIDGGVDTWEAVVWTEASGFRTLRAMLADEGVVIPANIRLRETFVSNDGRVIAGWAYNSTTQKYTGYVATLPAACRADFNGDGIANSQDFFDFLSAFFQQAASADFNADGTVNSQDFFDFLGAFFGGC